MKKILDCLKTYIDDYVSMKNWNKEAKKKFSLAVSSSFNFYLINLLETDFILLEPLQEFTADNYEKDIIFIQNKTEYPCVLALTEISTYMQKKFIKDKIAFVVEDNQISIPFLVLKVRAKIQEQKRQISIEKFTPFYQLIYLYLLYSDETEFAISDLSNKLKVSVMSILRAMNSFERLGMVKSEVGGSTNRKRLFYKIEQESFFDIGKKYLDNPVKKVMCVSDIPDGVKVYKSGLTALSEKSMLSEPKRKTFAIYKNVEKLKDYLISVETASDTNSPIIQIMKYDISLLAKGDCVDPLTIISELKEKDERIEMAISEMMEGYKWFTE